MQGASTQSPVVKQGQLSPHHFPSILTGHSLETAESQNETTRFFVRKELFVICLEPSQFSKDDHGVIRHIKFAALHYS